MARSIRLQWPGAHYHVMARGNRGQPIFLDDDDRRFFLSALGDACGRTGWRVHAWVLMGNHYHLLVETPEPNLVGTMQWLQNIYTRRFNTRHQLSGGLFGDRYKSVPVEAGSVYHYGALVNYIHLNPVRAGIVKPDTGRGLLAYPWSSLASAYALPPSQRAPWIAAAQGLALMNYPDTTAGRRRYVESLHQIARTEKRTQCGVPAPIDGADLRTSHLRRGWYWGSQLFEAKLNAMIARYPGKQSSRAKRRAPETKQHGESKAQTILKAELLTKKLTTAVLAKLPGSDPRKIEIATRIWQQTTVSQTWIADRLKMKSAANVSQILSRAKNPK